MGILVDIHSLRKTVGLVRTSWRRCKVLGQERSILPMLFFQWNGGNQH